MIQQFRHRPGGDPRRALKLLVLLVFVVVLVTGFVHVAAPGHDLVDAVQDCGLCHMLAQVAVALPVLLSVIAWCRAHRRTYVPERAVLPLHGRCRRAHAARGPPSAF